MISVVQDAGLSPDRVIWLSADNRAHLGSFELDIDCPDWREGENDNEGSIFLRLSDGRASAVMTGDAPSDAEQRMLPDEDLARPNIEGGPPWIEDLDLGRVAERGATQSRGGDQLWQR